MICITHLVSPVSHAPYDPREDTWVVVGVERDEVVSVYWLLVTEVDILPASKTSRKAS